MFSAMLNTRFEGNWSQEAESSPAHRGLNFVVQIDASWKSIPTFFPVVIHSDEGLTIETSASLSFYGGNLTFINLFNIKLS